MLDEKAKEVEAVLITVPDHTPAVIAMEAIRRGKHVYCEKPLADSIGEIRAPGKASSDLVTMRCWQVVFSCFRSTRASSS